MYSKDFTWPACVVALQSKNTVHMFLVFQSRMFVFFENRTSIARMGERACLETHRDVPVHPTSREALVNVSRNWIRSIQCPISCALP